MSTVDNLLNGIEIPEFVRVSQKFDDTVVGDDPVRILADKIEANEGYRGITPGMKIAVAVGSRGITGMPDYVRTIIAKLRLKGALPFIVPAMGSHAGATAEGQKAMLEGMGITEEYVGCEIRSSMDVEELGFTEKGVPVVMDKNAAGADGIVIINRIKPHVAFRGPYESGLMKMITIGLGKQRGAAYCHNLGFGYMAEYIPAIARVSLSKKNFIFAVGLVENAYHKTHTIEVLNAAEINDREPELQALAKTLAPRLHFSKFDICIMDEIGKNISGTGFDTGVVGRYHTPFISGGPTITKIGVLDLTDVSHGNANGIGIVDFTTQRLMDKFIPDQTYPNALTSTVPLSVKIPMVLKNDRQVFQAAIRTCNIVDKSKATIVRFRNTVALDELEVSLSMIDMVKECPYTEIISEPYSLGFNEEGNLF